MAFRNAKRCNKQSRLKNDSFRHLAHFPLDLPTEKLRSYSMAGEEVVVHPQNSQQVTRGRGILLVSLIRQQHSKDIVLATSLITSLAFNL